MKFLKIFSAILILTAVFFVTNAKAGTPKCVEEKTGTEFEAVIQNESKNICVGTGLRTAYFIVKVYAAAFYLDEKSLAELKNHKGDLAKELAEGKYARIVKMKFLNDIPADKLKEGFLEGLKDTMPNPSPKTKEQLDEFLRTMKDMKKGGEITIYLGYYAAGQLRPYIISANGTFVVDNKELSAGLLYLWLDNKPASPDLKANILKTLGGK